MLANPLVQTGDAHESARDIGIEHINQLVSEQIPIFLRRRIFLSDMKDLVSRSLRSRTGKNSFQSGRFSDRMPRIFSYGALPIYVG